MEEIDLTNKDEVIRAINEGKLSLQDVSEKFQDDKDVVIAAMKQDGSEYGNASLNMRYEHEVGLESIRHGGEYRYLVSYLRRDKETLLEAMQNGEVTWNRVPRQLQYDDDIMEAQDHPELIPEILKELRDEMAKIDWTNKEDVLTIMKKNGFAMEEYADRELFKDRDFILRGQKIYNYTFEYADEALWQKKEFVIDAVKIDAYNALEYAKNYIEDIEVMVEAAKQNKSVLRKITSEKLREKIERILREDELKEKIQESDELDATLEKAERLEELQEDKKQSNNLVENNGGDQK